MRWLVILKVATALLLAFALAHLIFIFLPHTAGVDEETPMMRVDNFPQIAQHMRMAQTTFSISSSAFEAHGVIPARYTCDGAEVSPPLTIEGTPESTASLVLIVEDPDVPKQLAPSGIFLHWLLFDIPPAVTEIPEGTALGTEGANQAGKTGYMGPCPPVQYEPREHRYVFSLYALDTALSLKAGSDVSEVRAAMEGHVIAETRLTARYARP